MPAPYYGEAALPKAHVTRMRLSMSAAVDTWVAGAFGDGVLCRDGAAAGIVGGGATGAFAEQHEANDDDARTLSAPSHCP